MTNRTNRANYLIMESLEPRPHGGVAVGSGGRVSRLSRLARWRFSQQLQINIRANLPQKVGAEVGAEVDT
jgi:hypothetical protein